MKLSRTCYQRNIVPTNQENFSSPRTLIPTNKMIPQYLKSCSKSIMICRIKKWQNHFLYQVFSICLSFILFSCCNNSFIITDKLWLLDGASFCTYDQDNDGSKSKVCTTDFHGGWWYAWSAFCTEMNPNGLYYHTYTPEKTGIFWFGFGSRSYHNLKEVRMMIRKP